MRMKSKVTMALVALCAVSAWADCGTCGSREKDEKAGAACGAGGCAVKAKTSAEAGGACVAAAVKSGAVDTAGVAALLKAKTPVVVLDARAGKYDDGKRIPGAKSLNASSADDEVAKLLPDKNALVVTYCAGLTCPASHKLAEKLKKSGYVNVLEYAEGMEGWLKAGNAVETAK